MSQSSSGRVSREQRGHILLLGLDRPSKRNAFDLDLLNDLTLAYGEFERNTDARVAIVFAHGEHFTAGLDLANIAPTLAAGWQPPAGACDPWGVFGGPRVSKPIIVAAQGYCLTIGIELMLAADINLCASNTRFAQMEVQRGILPFGGATVRFVQAAGWAKAMKYILTGDLFHAQEALAMNLITEIHHDPLARSIALAERVASAAPLAVQAALHSAHQAFLHSPEAAFANLQNLLTPLLQSEDAQEGVMAMLQRRAPEFKGK